MGGKPSWVHPGVADSRLRRKPFSEEMIRMPLYPHVQEVKKAQPLPKQPDEQIGVCLTCKYWQVEQVRSIH